MVAGINCAICGRPCKLAPSPGITGHQYRRARYEEPAATPPEPDAETIQTLLDLLNPLHGEMDRQLPEQFTDEHEWDAPPDREYNVNITAQMERDLTQAVLILENRKRSSPLAQRGREPGFVKPDTDRQVFFYEQDFYILSNFSAFQVRSYGIDFATSEHLYHWEKFNGEASHQPEIQREIRFARSAHDAFKIAEKYKASRRVDWDQVKVNVMANILRAKVQQHEYVRRKLLATGDRELIEDSWRDDFWGWGPNRDGRNELGKLWMDIRAELRGSPLSSTSRATPPESK
jgi:ribA/ribD-fused uncharacterized protein